jgi:hypothetical protein
MDILAFSSSFSKEIYSLRALTSSSSSSSLSGGYFLIGDVFLNPEALESLSGLIDSLNGEDSLTGEPPALLALLLPP